MICPSCGHGYTPPGPCTRLLDGDPCGYLDPEPTSRPTPTPRPEAEEQVTHPDRGALRDLDGDQAEANRAGIAAARDALREARQ